MATRRGPLSPSDPLLENALALDTLYNRRAQQDRQADSDARAAEELRLQQEHSARQQQIFEANRVQQERINKEHDDAVAKQLDTETRLAAAYAGVKDIDMTRRDAGQQLAQWKTFLAGRADPAQSRELFERHEEALKMFDYRRQKELAPLGINDFEYTKGPDGHERIDEAKTAEAVTRRKQSIQAEQKAWTPDENRLHTYMAGGELYGQLPPAIIHDIVEGSSKARYLLEWARENGVVITDTDMYGTDKIPGMAKELQPPGVKKTDTTWDIGLGNITATLYDLK